MVVKKILLFAKNDLWCMQAAKLAKVFFNEQIEIFHGILSDPFPKGLENQNYDLIISFLSPWIIPDWLLSSSKFAINFHPGSANYPGIGCYNFALYEEASQYGAICHHMFPKVDTGGIILEKSFQIFSFDTVESLKLRTMIIMLEMLHEVLNSYAIENNFNIFNHIKNWGRKPFTRKELNALTKISIDMPKDEIKKRLRALTYPGYSGLEFELSGIRFFSETPKRDPIA